MSGSDPDGPMEGPRSTEDVMKAAPAAPSAHPQPPSPSDPATDEATKAVEVGQEDA